MFQTRKSFIDTFHGTLLLLATLHLARRVLYLPPGTHVATCDIQNQNPCHACIPVRLFGFEDILKVGINELFEVIEGNYSVSCKLQTGIHQGNQDSASYAVLYLDCPVWKSYYLDLKKFALNQANSYCSSSTSSCTNVKLKKYVMRPVAFYCIILSGDVEINPGPNSTDSCVNCNQNFRANARKLLCSDCGAWLHMKCAGVSDSAFKKLNEKG
jgi:hypothetical protein